MTSENKELPPPIAPPPPSTHSPRKSEKGVLCAKCNHLNKPGSTKCSRCESHLHIKCHDCGAINERVLSKCKECGRRLHKSGMEKIRSRMSKGQTAKITPMQVVLLIVLVAVVFLFVHGLNQLTLPSTR